SLPYTTAGGSRPCSPLYACMAKPACLSVQVTRSDASWTFSTPAVTIKAIMAAEARTKPALSSDTSDCGFPGMDVQELRLGMFTASPFQSHSRAGLASKPRRLFQPLPRFDGE